MSGLPTKCSCYRCGKEHDPQSCRFKEACCHWCGKLGHIAPVCRSAKKKDNYQRPHFSCQNKLSVSGDVDELPCVDELPLNQIFVIGAKALSPIQVQVTIEDQALSMEVDTGTAVSIISQRQQWSLLPNSTLRPSNARLKTYTGAPMEAVGEDTMEVSCNKQCHTLPLIVVAERGPALFGRNWLRHIKLNWRSICALSLDQSPKC